MNLIVDEELILSSNDDNIVLTNQRIEMNTKEWGKSYSIGIFLEDISSIEIKYQSNPILLALAAIVFIGGFSIGREQSIFAIIISLIIIAIWYFTKKHVISISSKGGAVMRILIQRMGNQKIAEFLFEIKNAKAKRAILLSKS